MNKIKLFGCALMGAFMAFNLASCEKENFSTSTDVTVTPPTINIPGVTMPDTYEPGNAVVSIQPTVNALINGSISNVTEPATIKIGGKTAKYEVITDKTIAAQEITISVSYTAVVDGFEKVLEATEKVQVPAMEAGMVAIITPTIWLSVNTKGYYAEEKNETKEEGEKIPVSIKNETNWFYPNEDATIKYIKSGSYVTDLKYTAGYENDSEVKEEVEKIIKGMSQEYEYTTITVKNINIYAQSQTIIPVSQSKITTDYIIKRTIEWSRSVEEKIVATITVESYGELIVYTEEIKTDVNLKGEEYGHGHGTGDGHGHGDFNAGGSIVDAL